MGTRPTKGAEEKCAVRSPQAHVTLSQFEQPLHETHAAAFRLHDEQHGQGHASRNEQAHRAGPAGPASP